MSKITTILLDYGRVVAPEDAEPVVQEVYGASPEDMGAYELFGSAVRSLGLGEANEDDVRQKLEAYGITVPADYRERWRRNIEEHLYPVPTMLELVAELKAQGYTVALLSNVWPLSMEIIREHGWYDHFDQVFLSCDLHMSKPDPEFYDTAIRALGVPPEQILFVDDKQKNLTYPEEIGMKTFLAENPAHAVKGIRKLLDL